MLSNSQFHSTFWIHNQLVNSLLIKALLLKLYAQQCAKMDHKYI